MRRSKLELYEDIIGALTKKALTIDDIAFECNMNCVTLQQRLEFLMNNNLVDLEISLDNRTFYVLTRRGLAISRTLVIAKGLEKMQRKPSINHDEALRAIAALTENDEEKELSRNL